MKVYELGDEGATKDVRIHGLFKTISKVYPLLLVLALSLTVDVTVKVVLVPCRDKLLVDIVTVRPESEIQARVSGSGEKDSVSVWLQPAY